MLSRQKMVLLALIECIAYIQIASGINVTPPRVKLRPPHSLEIKSEESVPTSEDVPNNNLKVCGDKFTHKKIPHKLSTKS